jgi:YfiH family protein
MVPDTLPPTWLVPDWPAPPAVRAVCTSREGGCSASPFDSFNLGDHVGDAATCVQANRHRLRALIGVRPVFLRQVHSCRVVVLNQDAPDGLEADACVSTGPGVACTIMVADCLPVLLADRRGRCVAAAHAGWRGLAAGVLASTVATLEREAGVAPVDLLAWLGPCIGPRSFEVGDEVRAAFGDAGFDIERGFRQAPAAPGKWLADLPSLAREHLHRLGVVAVYGNDGTPDWCTVLQPSRFFSHRRDAIRLGSTGRMAACVWLD